MASQRRSFWEHESFVVIGHTGARSFPKMTYRGLRDSGKTVFAVDPSLDEVEGDPAFPDLAALPSPVEAAVLELPKDETAAWVARASPTPASRRSGSTSAPTHRKHSPWPPSAASRSAPAPAR